MAELIGLKMQGIRSIGDEPHLISFLHPLTIIQGPNGTGKTTIIEALITLLLEPCHLEKCISQQSQSRCTGQLQFKDTKGNTCTATRRMNASNAKTGKAKTQSDEFTLVVKDKFGNNKSLSSKVADFNKEMLNLLGVPRAILEHVIFCHQEESNCMFLNKFRFVASTTLFLNHDIDNKCIQCRPLCEPKELKIRFDAIFEVTKYVKALDGIKKNMKELETQLKLIDTELPHLESNKHTMKSLSKSHDQSKTTLEVNKKAIEEHKANKVAIDEKIKDLSKDLELAGNSKHKTDLIQDYFGSREDLIEELNRLRSSISEQQAEKEQKALAKEIEQKLRSAEEDMQLNTRSLNRNEQVLNQAANTITIKQAQLSNYTGIISEVSSDRDSIESRLEEVRLMLSKSRSNLGQIDGCRFLYEKWEDEIESSQACPLCERSCSTQNETKKLLQKVKHKQENLPSETRSLESKVRKYEEEEQKLTKVMPYLSMSEAIEKELPKLQEQVKRSGEIVKKEREAKEIKQSEVVELREKLKKAQDSRIDSKTQEHEIRILEEQLRKMDLQTQLSDLQKQLEAFNGQNSELMAKASTLNNLIYQKSGEQTQIATKIKELAKELNNPRYTKAKQNYLDKLIERAVTQSTIEDLGKYWKVLDDAIISFHQQKMAQINQILKELWMRVYKGNDIESIKIKSQPVTGGEKKKSYDYSVVMVVDQVEIDMRDHCSAGQKVLAAILIRIALADVFAGNCPILALDEPTTNLDADKVENVGMMLKSLIEVRNEMSSQDDDDMYSQSQAPTPSANGQPKEGQRSLQLLVITHDKRLVDHLYLACRPEWIYGLSKDENGTSRIRKHKRVCETQDQGDW
uniref:Zinc-hook domain-containing protein n=1 Tax=Ditylenchus dipsaci TaxID=166011 RepID=A0A915EDG1_9BILA